VDGFGQGLEARYAIIAGQGILEGRNLAGRMHIGDARDDEAHTTPGKLFVHFELPFRDVAVPFRTAVVGGGPDKAVLQGQALDLDAFEEDAHGNSATGPGRSYE